MNIKAAIARRHDRTLAIEGLDLGDPRAGEIVVRLVACGLSRADTRAIDGDLAMPLPFVPGAEGAGIVEHVGDDVTSVEAGDAVILTAASCGHCARCGAGHPRDCEAFAALNLSGRRLDGSTPFSDRGQPVAGFFMGQSALATHLVCPAACAIKVPMDAPLEVLAPLGGAMLEGACAVARGFRIGHGDSLVVTGAGPAGLLAIMLAKGRGAGLIVVSDPDETRRELATELGATIAVHTDDDLASVVRSMVSNGARFALETTGRATARKACLDSLARGGICALTDPPTSAALGFDDQLADGDVMVMAAADHMDAAALVSELVALHVSEQLPIERLLGFFPFELVNDALDALRDGHVVKPVVRFSLGAFGDLDRAEMEGAASEAPAEPEPEDAPKQEVPEREPSVPA